MKLDDNDQYLWLEDILGKESLLWVEQQNKKTTSFFQSKSEVSKLEEIYLEISEREQKIRHGRLFDDMVVIFKSDKHNPRGMLQISRREDYLNKNPMWQTILNFDELGKKENASWVYKSAQYCDRNGQRVLLSLSHGGQDSVCIREFDIPSMSFVGGGFDIPDGKSSAVFIDQDTVLLADATSEQSKTNIGYPKKIKLLKRGQALGQALDVFSGNNEDMSVRVMSLESSEGKSCFLIRHAFNFYSADTYWFDEKNVKVIKLPFIKECEVLTQMWGDFLIVKSMKPWSIQGKNIPTGSFIGFNLKKYREEQKEDFFVLCESSKEFIIEEGTATEKYLYVLGNRDVKSALKVFSFDEHHNIVMDEIELPGMGTAHFSFSHYKNNLLQLTFESFLNPPCLYLLQCKDQMTLLQEQKTNWNSDAYESIQMWATSKDGTKIPYFVVKNKNSKLDGKNPTLLNGYGGFLVSMLPTYSEYNGRAWLDAGGVFVLGNIRGGGEYGPEWHQSAILENKQKSYEDFIAIAEDLIENKVTSPRYLGIKGGSNGGLLMGAMMTQRPDLFSAIICTVPLLDMMRYNQMKNAKGDIVGHSWVAEYGDPVTDPKMAEIIMQYSPYQNLKREVKYPSIFLFTSTKDDRVVPSHARKMAAKLAEYNHRYWYYENLEGGHVGGADPKQAAYFQSLLFAYLKHELME